MIIRCAWCKKITGDKPPFGGKYDTEVTDGICADCEKREFGDMIKEKGGRVNLNDERHAPRIREASLGKIGASQATEISDEAILSARDALDNADIPTRKRKLWDDKTGKIIEGRD